MDGERSASENLAKRAFFVLARSPPACRSVVGGFSASLEKKAPEPASAGRPAANPSTPMRLHNPARHHSTREGVRRQAVSMGKGAGPRANSSARSARERTTKGSVRRASSACLLESSFSRDEKR